MRAMNQNGSQSRISNLFRNLHASKCLGFCVLQKILEALAPASVCFFIALLHWLRRSRGAYVSDGQMGFRLESQATLSSKHL